MKRIPLTKKQACAQKIKDVEAMVDELTEKHVTKYSVDQLNTWAHMIQMGKQVSTEVPSALPYFGKAASSKEAGTQPVQPSSPQPVALCMVKRITLLSESTGQVGPAFEEM